MKTVIIGSGGLDSTVLIYDAITQGYKPEILTFDYRQRHLIREQDCLRETITKLTLPYKFIFLPRLLKSTLTNIKLPITEEHYTHDNQKQTVVPNRNMIMLSMAAGYCESEHIRWLMYGAHSNDLAIYWDCRPNFVGGMNEVLDLNDVFPVKLLTPYLYLKKADIVKRGIELKVPFEDTWTCYYGEELACGKCASCQERLEAFKLNDAKDPVKYKEAV